MIQIDPDYRNDPAPGWKVDEPHWGHWLLLVMYMGTPLFFVGWWLVDVLRGL